MVTKVPPRAERPRIRTTEDLAALPPVFLSTYRAAYGAEGAKAARAFVLDWFDLLLGYAPGLKVAPRALADWVDRILQDYYYFRPLDLVFFLDRVVDEKSYGHLDLGTLSERLAAFATEVLEARADYERRRRNASPLKDTKRTGTAHIAGVLAKGPAPPS